MPLPVEPPALLPVVVQLGFSGSRQLYDPGEHPELDASAFDQAVEEHLESRLGSLPQELGLSPRHLLCGISQIAAGADLAFTRALATLRICQRVFLPQHPEDYLTAGGSSGPDFDPAEEREARRLLASPHIIQIRVVSDAARRPDRFEDCMLETVRVSDVLVCLIRAEDQGKTGGSHEMIRIARKRGRPLLVISLAVKNGQPCFEETWHHRERFRPPVLPDALNELEVPPGAPDITSFLHALKEFGSHQADSRQVLFKTSALLILGAHLFATLCAVFAVVFYRKELLLPEFFLLAAGFAVHEYLHWSHASRTWALSRVVAEISRSLQAFAGHHVYLSHLFQLPFPRSLTPLLRTLNVLHLQASPTGSEDDWKVRRDRYLAERFTGNGSQIAYHATTRRRSALQLGMARWTFVACTLGALVCTAIKVTGAGDPKFLGALAIILPVLAVGALSLAAAFDLEARVHVSEETLADLAVLAESLANASSEREFTRLLVEAEARLLGETANWFSRRSFTGVA